MGIPVRYFQNSVIDILRSDHFSDFPVDLILIHFLVPSLFKSVKLKPLVRRLIETWYHFASKQLRLSSFLMGGEYPDEESDVEDDDQQPQIRYATINPFRKPTQHRKKRDIVGHKEATMGDGSVQPLNDSDDDSWEDEPSEEFNSSGESIHKTKSQPTHKSKKSTREFRYLRVPKRDHIVVIPGQKMLIPMRDNDPVFGRSNETPDEVETNWTKVYVPDHFKWRVNHYIKDVYSFEYRYQHF